MDTVLGENGRQGTEHPRSPCGATDDRAPFLQSERLWFRAPGPLDAELFCAWRNDGRFRMNTGRLFPETQQAVAELIQQHNPAVSPGSVSDRVSLFFGPQGDGRPIGGTSLFKIDWVDRHAEWGILIGEPEQWGKGYAREVAGRMLQYGFLELNLHRVYLRVLESNIGGIKAYQAAGFVQEGVERKAAWMDGGWQDLLMMSVLYEEWAERPSA